MSCRLTLTLALALALALLRYPASLGGLLRMSVSAPTY